MLVFFQITRIVAAGIAAHLSLISHLSDSTTDYGTTNIDWNDFQSFWKTAVFFPDALYSCQPNNLIWKEFAEFTHWPNFIRIALEYWLEKYGPYENGNNMPNSKSLSDSIVLKSFILGVLSHQIVDVSWHSLLQNYRNDGLLRVLSETEFNGDIKKAHNFLDTMGDFIVLNNWVKADFANDIHSWSYFNDFKWELPREEDMLEIIRRTNISKHQLISYSDLEKCVKRGQLAVETELLTIKLNRPQILAPVMLNYPNTFEFLQEFWLGGEWDLLNMNRKCLHDLKDIFSNTTAIELLINDMSRHICDNLPHFTTRNSQVNDPTSEKVAPLFKLEVNPQMAKIISPYNKFSNFGSSMTLGNFMNDDITYLAVSSPLEGSNGGVYLIPYSIINNNNNGISTSSDNEQPRLLPVTPMFGHKVDRYSIDTIDFLVVSEPGTNTLKFFLQERLILSITEQVTAIMKQLRVGLIADLMDSGINDIIVTTENIGNCETGGTFFIKGEDIIMYLLNGRRNQVLKLSDIISIKLHDLVGTIDYGNFGSIVKDSKRGDKIYITEQNSATIFIFGIDKDKELFIPKFTITSQSISPMPFTEEKNDRILLKSKKHGMFGKIIISWAYQDKFFVAISQHLFNNVYIYEEHDNGEITFFAQLELKFSLSTIPYNVGFGKNMEYSNIDDSLYITSPNSFNGVGAVFKVSMNEIIGNKITTVVEKHLYYGNFGDSNSGFTNFGKAIAIGPNNELIVGLPQYGYGKTGKYALTGAILVIR